MNTAMHESLAVKVKRDVPLLDVVGEYAGEIKQHGKTHVCRCLCGENSDRNPSFMLYDDHYHCFACNRHGSVIDLIMLVEQLDFKAALAFLCRRYLSYEGRDIQPRRIVRRPDPSSKKDISDEIKSLLDAATQHYQSTLVETPDVLGMLHSRGLTDTTIAQLKVGYACGDLGPALFAHGNDLTLAARAGLLSARGEFLRGRIVFPVLDAQDQTVWMIGRAVSDGDTPKYLGLPEGAVYKQPMVLGTARRGTIWVEGAFDFATLVQWGIDAEYLLIGMLGTAFESIVQTLLTRLSPHAIVCTDQDLAGKQAALKLALLLREHGVQPVVLADVERQQLVSAWVARAQHNPDLSEPERAKLTRGKRELAVVDTLVEHRWVRWVRWGHRIKDPGDLCKMGERGRRWFLDALTD
jgi:DNA primase